jgi:hypothetical protein
MAIAFQYGSYTHAVGECQVQIARRITRSANGTRSGYVDQYVVNGQLHADNVSALNSAIVSLKNAYASDGKSFGLRDTTAGKLYPFAESSQSVIRVVEGPSFPDGAGAEYTTYRTYRITIEAESQERVDEGDFRESVTVSGGGPRYVLIEVLNGPPQKQLVVPYTVCTIVQEGSASSDVTYPPFAAPLLPDLQLVAPDVRYESPRLENGVLRDYRTSWTYRFGTGSAPQNVRPNLPRP